jgi:Icc-related predicted phosphoesterase
LVIDCIADLHGHYPKLDGGDLLIICGDLTARDMKEQHMLFLSWLLQQEYRKIIWIAGNHDKFMKGTKYIPIKDTGLEYLCDSGTEFEGLKIWGSPWTPPFVGQNPDCMAFTFPRCNMYQKWDLIPEDTDILITHGPPYGFFDETVREERVGCMDLRNQVMGRIKPKLHCFGHIHEGGGSIIDTGITKFVNCSYVNEYYEPVNPVMRVVL